jgi:LysM repeat protein
MHAKYLFFFLLVTASAGAQPAGNIAAYINQYRDIAIAEEQRTGVPAAIKLAQGIHETQAGTSELVRKSNNHFGIKCKASWMGERVYHDDDARGECFRSYTRPEQSYRDHSDFLRGSPRYAFLFQLDPTDYKAWASGLRQAGYATNYRYAQILVKLIEDYQLEQYTLIALGKLPPVSEPLVAGNPVGNTSSVVIQAVNPATAAAAAVTTALQEATITVQRPDYPEGQFSINNARCVFVKQGSSLLSVAEEYHISFAHVLDFNDLNDGDLIKEDQVIYTQRKRRKGATLFHIVQPGETMYYICQAEGIALENLLAYNLLTDRMQPAPGEKLYLQTPAQERPMLVNEKKLIVNEAIVAPLTKTTDSTTHIVQTKETLYSISKKYGVSLDQLKSWNKLDSAAVKIGQQLLIYSN